MADKPETLPEPVAQRLQGMRALLGGLRFCQEGAVEVAKDTILDEIASTLREAVKGARKRAIQDIAAALEDKMHYTAAAAVVRQLSEEDAEELIAAVDKARQFPNNTCPASRHTQQIGEHLIEGTPYPMLTEEGPYCGHSILCTVKALYDARAERDALREDAEKLRAFAKAVMGDWPDVGGLDGFDLQELGEKHGLLEKLERVAPCGEFCQCAENETGPVECFRLTRLVKGAAIDEARGKGRER